MDREKVIKAVEDLLEALGEDNKREGLADTRGGWRTPMRSFYRARDKMRKSI